MKRPDARLAIGGVGLAAACAVVCCSAPLLVVAVPGLALAMGWVVESIEAGLIAAVVLGALAGIGVLVRRRRHGRCSEGSDCGCGRRAGMSSPSAQLHWPVERPGVPKSQDPESRPIHP